MLITRTEIAGHARCDVRIEAGRIAAIAPALSRRDGERVLDAAGGALLPGLHDHHLHLFALAAAERSVRCGPPHVRDAGALGARLSAARREAAPGAWIRGVGYHESVAGRLDRRGLDAWVDDRPLRIQHRSGALWMVNGAGVRALALDRAEHPGVERDERGAPTGRILRADAWLRARLGTGEVPCLSDVGRTLSRAGVTGVTDATPSNGNAELAALGAALSNAELSQRVLLMGGPKLGVPRHERLTRGARKILLTETALPTLDALRSAIAAAHDDDRSVAIHCVTRTELVFAVAAFEAAGCRRGDRIEHAAIADPASLERLAALPLTVVTQPNFVAERGDVYRREVLAADQPYLYRCRGFLEARVPLGAGTDAPFGEADPWAAMRAAVERSTSDGAVLGPDETLSPERALALFTSPAEAPGDPPRAIAPGARADLCLLDRPWSRARQSLCREHVAATLCAGDLAWEA